MIVFHQDVPLGFGACRIAENYSKPSSRMIVGRVGLARNSKGKMQFTLLVKEFEVGVEEFGTERKTNAPHHHRHSP